MKIVAAGRHPEAAVTIRHVVLMGLMGAGKTTVGRELATRLGWPLRDSDADIRAATSRTARQLDEELGTAALHRHETRHLRDAILAAGPSVICAAASTIDDPLARESLGAGGLLLVWLRAEPATLVRRTRRIDHRRDLGPDRTASLTAQAAERYPRFAALLPLTVTVDDRPPLEIVRTIAQHLDPRA